MNEIHTGPNAKIQEQRIKGRLPSDIQLARHKRTTAPGCCTTDIP